MLLLLLLIAIHVSRILFLGLLLALLRLWLLLLRLLMVHERLASVVCRRWRIARYQWSILLTRVRNRIGRCLARVNRSGIETRRLYGQLLTGTSQSGCIALIRRIAASCLLLWHVLGLWRRRKCQIALLLARYGGAIRWRRKCVAWLHWYLLGTCLNLLLLGLYGEARLLWHRHHVIAHHVLANARLRWLWLFRFS
jgi:hypothetical protein